MSCPWPRPRKLSRSQQGAACLRFYCVINCRSLAIPIPISWQAQSHEACTCQRFDRSLDEGVDEKNSGTGHEYRWHPRIAERPIWTQQIRLAAAQLEDCESSCDIEQQRSEDHVGVKLFVCPRQRQQSGP